MSHWEIQNLMFNATQGISSRVFTPCPCLSAQPTRGNKLCQSTGKAKCLGERMKNQNGTQTY